MASASFPGLVVISAAGDVELATVPVLRDALQDALQAGGHIILDLARVTFFDQAGFRDCMRYWRLCQKNQRVLALVNSAPIVRKVVKILDVHRLLTLFASVEEASKMLLDRARDSRARGDPTLA